MTTAALPADRTTALRSEGVGRSGTFLRVTAAEWIKFRTVRSTVWTLVAMVVLMVGISVLAAWGTINEAVDAGAGPMNAAQLLGAGYQMAQLTVAVLAVLTITGEYSTGMIRSTLTAVPRRVPVLGAKALVLSAVVFVATVVSMALSYVATVPFHDQLDVRFDLTDGETLRMAFGLPLYLTAIALLAFAIGALLRHSAGALTAVIALLLVVENVLFLIPMRAIEVISPFLPSTAGRRILFDEEMVATVNAASSGAPLTPWQGYGVLVGWVVALLALAVVLLRRRDA
jgi:ABC-2 type transport system permease protein